MTTRSLRSSRSSWYWPPDSSISVAEASATSESSASPHSQRSKRCGPEQPAQLGRDLLLLAVGPDLLVEPGGLARGSRADRSSSVLGPRQVGGHRAPRPAPGRPPRRCRARPAARAARLRAGADLLPQGRGRGFQVRLALAALGVLRARPRRPALPRRRPGRRPGRRARRAATTESRARRRSAQAAVLVAGQSLRGPSPPRPAPGRRVRAASRAWPRASSAAVIASSVPATSGSAGAAGERRRHLVRVAPG